MTKAAEENPRAGWDAQFQRAEEAGENPDADLFEGISNKFDHSAWTWQLISPEIVPDLPRLQESAAS